MHNFTYTITKLNKRLKGGNYIDGVGFAWSVDVDHCDAADGSPSAEWMVHYYDILQWCEETWGRALAIDLSIPIRNLRAADPVVCNPHWAYECAYYSSGAGMRCRIYLKTDAELVEFKSVWLHNP